MNDELFASPRSRLVTMLLAFFLGVFGVHRFYVGKIGSGLGMLFTLGGLGMLFTLGGLGMLFTLGGLGIWWLADNIMILAGAFRDAEGRLVSEWEPESDRMLPPGTAAAILDELDQLRAEVADLNERVDFAERLLADPDRNPGRRE